MHYPVAALHRAPLLEELGLLGETSPVEVAVADRTSRYQDLCERADVYWAQDGRDSRHEPRPSARLRRSRAVRDAVLLRSGGRCENPRCTGDVGDVTDRGAPILEVDHVQDLALGGPDKPAVMIALCPNCHAVKTRGRSPAGSFSRNCSRSLNRGTRISLLLPWKPKYPCSRFLGQCTEGRLH